MQLGEMKSLALDLMSAILTGKYDGEGLPPEVWGNRELLVVLTTSLAVLLGCVLLLLWRRSGGKKATPAVEPPRPLEFREETEHELDSGKRKVNVFFGTQTGTAEGFAKVRIFDSIPPHFLSWNLFPLPRKVFFFGSSFFFKFFPLT